MRKIAILLFFTYLINSTASAQKLSPNERSIFDEVVFERAKIGEYEKIKKWVLPIRYKIYGDTSAYLVKEVDSNFSEIKRLTALDVRRTYNDDEANFIIVFGKDPDSFQNYTTNGKPLTSPGNYKLRSNKNGEIFWAQNLFNTEKYGSRTVVKNAIKRQMLRVMGFQKTTEKLSNSLFSSAPNIKTKIDDFDGHIISALYSPSLRPGMDRDQVDKILAGN